MGIALAATWDPAALPVIEQLLKACRGRDGARARVTMLEEADWGITTRDLDALESVSFDWPAVRIAAARFLAKLPPEPAHVDALAAQIRVEADAAALKAEAQALLDLREAEASDELKGLVGASPVPDADKVLTEALREHAAATLQR